MYIYIYISRFYVSCTQDCPNNCMHFSLDYNLQRRRVNVAPLVHLCRVQKHSVHPAKRLLYFLLFFPELFRIRIRKFAGEGRKELDSIRKFFSAFEKVSSSQGPPRFSSRERERASSASLARREMFIATQVSFEVITVIACLRSNGGADVSMYRRCAREECVNVRDPRHAMEDDSSNRSNRNRKRPSSIRRPRISLNTSMTAQYRSISKIP
jgi:hypothetical protein